MSPICQRRGLPVPGMPLWEAVHDLKLEALEEIIAESNGQPILCSYAYRSDAERIMQRFADTPHQPHRMP